MTNIPQENIILPIIIGIIRGFILLLIFYILTHLFLTKVLKKERNQNTDFLGLGVATLIYLIFAVLTRGFNYKAFIYILFSALTFATYIFLK